MVKRTQNIKSLVLAAVIALVVSIPNMVQAQVDPQISTEEFSRVFINPAAIGQSNYINARLLSRHQWTGFPEAPSTQMLSLSNYFDRFKVGLGLHVVNDNLGVESNQMIKLKYSYHAFFNKNSYLSLGLGTGIWSRSFDSSKLRFEENNDPSGTSNDYKAIMADFDFGAEFTYKQLKVGIGSSHISHTYSGIEGVELPRHDYAYIQYAFDVNKEIKVSNGVSISHTGNIYHTELYCAADFRQKIKAGISYRLKEAIVIMSQVNITDNLMIGYAYDLGVGQLRSYHNGTHEVLIAARFNKFSRKKFKSPRFFD